MIYLKIATLLICAGLNIIGGYSWHNARRFIMPVVIASSVCFLLHSFWGLTCLLAIAPLTTGYGEKSLIWKYFNDAWGRFIWMVMVATAFTIFLIITHHINIFIALVYIIGNGIIGMVLRKYNQLFSDAVFGITLSSFILFVR